MPAAALATDPVNAPGYMVFDRIVDENYAEGTARIPGRGGRDWQNVTLYHDEAGVEYLETCGNLSMDAAAAESLFPGAPPGPPSRPTAMPAGIRSARRQLARPWRSAAGGRRLCGL